MSQNRPIYRAHDNYISLNFGGGRTFTCARSGMSAANMSDEVFMRLHNEINRVMKEFQWNQGQAMRHVCDCIDTLWPEWDDIPTFAKNDNIRLGDRIGIVLDKKRTNYLVRFEDGQEEMVSPVLMRKVGPNAKRGGA